MLMTAALPPRNHPAGFCSDASPVVVSPGTEAHGMTVTVSTVPVKPVVLNDMVCVDPAVMISENVAELDREVPAVPPPREQVIDPAERVRVNVT